MEGRAQQRAQQRARQRARQRAQQMQPSQHEGHGLSFALLFWIWHFVTFLEQQMAVQ